MGPKELLSADISHVWHPFTQMSEWAEAEPLMVERAEGNYLYGPGGERYLDGVSSLWVNVHGHRHPAIDAAIRAQLDKVAHSTLLGLASGPAAQLAAELAEVAPGPLTRVFYSDNGSTAVEVALKQAFQYWQLLGQDRRRFVHLENSYHGDTLGATSVGGIPVFHAIFGPLMVAHLVAPSPHPLRHPAGPEPAAVRDAALAGLRAQLESHRGEVAAVIVEPLVQGAAGIHVHPPGYLSGVAELCREFDTLLIADEVATGFGRTGKLFACEHEGVEPDLLCLAKGITGGVLPLAATLSTDRIYSAFLGKRSEGKAFYHGHSYTGNALACAAAIASLRLFAEERTLERVARSAEVMSSELDRLARHPRVAEARQRGLMVGIELAAEGTRPYPAELAMGHQICMRARRHGVVVRNLGDTVVLMPPLSIEPGEVSELVAAVGRAIAEVTEAPEA